MVFRYEKCMVEVTAIFSSVLGIFSNSEKIGWFGFWKKFWMEICFLFLLTFRRSNWSSDSFYCIGKKDIFGIDYYKWYDNANHVDNVWFDRSCYGQACAYSRLIFRIELSQPESICLYSFTRWLITNVLRPRKAL